jgi:hypothetical protein
MVQWGVWLCCANEELSEYYLRNLSIVFGRREAVALRREGRWRPHQAEKRAVLLSESCGVFVL